MSCTSRFPGHGHTDLHGILSSPGDVLAGQLEPACETELWPASLTWRKAGSLHGRSLLQAGHADARSVLLSEGSKLVVVCPLLCRSH